ncbi:MAG TPA: isochorismatase family cysteine hydrolase [Mucilaginibacter sp.]|nr:isochorismatase family cysteine hydrolase [Mucilaginibacter sp.]
MNSQNTALLVMDMQSVMVGMVPDTTIVDKVAKAINHARSNSIPVIYVVVGFRDKMPEISMNNKGFMAAKERFANVNMADFITIHPGVAPQGDEITVIKRRVSAFTGSDLEVVLRAKEIKHLVLTGIATSGVVLSTVREAADKDYRLTVLSDCCADRGEEVHRVLTTKVFINQADVVTVDEWVAQ